MAVAAHGHVVDNDSKMTSSNPSHTRSARFIGLMMVLENYWRSAARCADLKTQVANAETP
jgi:hypothetical protein